MFLGKTLNFKLQTSQISKKTHWNAKRLLEYKLTEVTITGNLTCR